MSFRLLYLEDISTLAFWDCGMGLELLVGWDGEAVLAFTFSAVEVLHHAAKQAAVKVYCNQTALLKENTTVNYDITSPY